MLLLIVIVKIVASFELATFESSSGVIGKQVRAPAAPTMRNVVSWRSSTAGVIVLRIVVISRQVVILKRVVHLGAKNDMLRIGMLLRQVAQHRHAAKLAWSTLRAQDLIVIIADLLRVGMWPDIWVSVPRIVFPDVIVVHQDTLELRLHL